MLKDNVFEITFTEALPEGEVSAKAEVLISDGATIATEDVTIEDKTVKIQFTEGEISDEMTMTLTVTVDGKVYEYDIKKVDEEWTIQLKEDPATEDTGNTNS